MKPAPTTQGPIRLIDVELSQPIADVASASHYQRARVLARLHGHPLGTVDVALDHGRIDASVLVTTLWRELRSRIAAHCAEDGATVPATLPTAGLGCMGPTPCSWRRQLRNEFPFATLVITTCGGEASSLTATLATALAQSYPRFEVVVVDNRPATSGVRRLLEQEYASEARIRYVAEPRQGLSHARNCGAATARGEVLAFTDDDVDIDPDWLGFLVAGFDHPSVACVTGLILPLKLETSAELLLEEYGGYGKGFDRRTWDRGENRPADPLFPYRVGMFGSGANAAFRRDAFVDIGRFDGALGAGTKSRGGEDLDIYVTCIERGYQIVYEPGAIIRHAHLRDTDQIHQKVRDYGVGLGAMLTKHLLRDWPTFAAMTARLPRGMRYLLAGRSPKHAARSSSYPSSLTLAELAGVLYGPVAYCRSRRAA